MRRIGDAFEPRDGSADGMQFRIIASDILKTETYGRPMKMLVSTQSAINGSEMEGTQYINGPTGWELFPNGETYANFAMDDGSVRTSRNVRTDSVSRGTFVQTGYYFPTELAE